MNAKITLPELAAAMARNKGLSPKLCEEFLRRLFGGIAASLSSGESVRIRSLGTFRLTDVEARRSVDVSTGQEIEIPAHRRVTFVPAKDLAAKVNEPFEAFEAVEVPDGMDDETLASLGGDGDGVQTSSVADKESVHEDVVSGDVVPVNTVTHAGNPAVASCEEYALNDSDEECASELPAVQTHDVVSDKADEDYGQKAIEASADQFADPVAYDEVASDDSDDGLPESESVVAEDMMPAVLSEPDVDTMRIQSEQERMSEEMTADMDDVCDTCGESLIEPADAVKSDLTASESLASVPEQAVLEQFSTPADTAEPSHEPEKTESDVNKRRCGFGWGFMAGAATVLLMVALAAGIFYFFVERELTRPDVEAAVHDNPSVSDNGGNNRVAAKVTDVPADTRNAEACGDASEKEAKSAAVPATKPSDTEKSTPDGKVYDTITHTRYLTTMAKDHYGNYNLWPYIYEENAAILGHPDRIKPGTKVVIPSLSKYGVNPHSESDIREAKRKGVAIYARYK